MNMDAVDLLCVAPDTELCAAFEQLVAETEFETEFETEIADILDLINQPDPENTDLSMSPETDDSGATSPASSESTEKEEDVSSVASSDSASTTSSHSDNHRKASKAHKAQSTGLSKEALRAAEKARASLGAIPPALRAHYDATLSLPRVREALGFPYVKCASASTTLLTPSNLENLDQMTADQNTAFWKGLHKLWHERNLTKVPLRNCVLKKEFGFSKAQISRLGEHVKNQRNGTSNKQRASDDLTLLQSALARQHW